MKLSIFAYLFLIITLLISCTTETLIDETNAHFLLGDNNYIPCYAIDESNVYLQYELNNTSYCVDSSFITAQSICALFSRRKIVNFAAGVPDGYQGPSMPNLRISIPRTNLGNLYEGLLDLKYSNLLTQKVPLSQQVQISLWFSNIAICDEEGSSQNRLKLPQIFTGSEFLEDPYGEGSYLRIIEIQPTTISDYAFLIDFVFSMDIYDSNHQVVKIRNGKGRGVFRW